jgi:hypothetical protein
MHPFLGAAGYWAQSYWGGAVTAAGAALIFGGMGRLMSRPRASCAFAASAGVSLLVFSRPYEGLLIVIPSGVFLLYWMMRRPGACWAVFARRIIAPVLITGTLGLAALCIYNFRVANDPFRLPYQVHEESYARASAFVWQEPRPEPEYRHEFLRAYHTSWLPRLLENQRSIGGLIKERLNLLLFLSVGTWNVLAIPVIATIPLTAFGWLQSTRQRVAIAIYACFLAGTTVEVFMTLHYLAPVVPLNFFFVLNALRFWQLRNRRVAGFLFWLMPVSAAILLTSSLQAGGARYNRSTDWHLQRARLLEEVKQRPGKHLILVSYGPHQSIHEEWVYNGAEIDAAPVVWARIMDTERNCRLLEYFNERHIWTLELNGNHSVPALTPYSAEPCN